MKDSEERNVTWRAAAVGLAVFYALVVLMNAPAMEKNAENMDYGVARDATKALVRPVARLSAMFRLDFLRRGAARVRGRWFDQKDTRNNKETNEVIAKPQKIISRQVRKVREVWSYRHFANLADFA